MHDFQVLEPAIDPNNRSSFLLDWEITLKCNLDCSYCDTGLYGGHDNSTKHPNKKDCESTIDFLFDYVDRYMSHRPRGLRYVVLNVYGGESLHHPDIVHILSSVRDRYSRYRERWHLTVTTTTNAIISRSKLTSILPLIDEFTVSYHSENTPKQKKLFKDNLLAIAAAGKKQKCVVLMHGNPDLFRDSQDMIEWLKSHGIKLLPRQLDGHYGTGKSQRIYGSQQVKWFETLYNDLSHRVQINLPGNQDGTSLTDVGRACCGGRQVCSDQDYRNRSFFVQNQFPDWYCSVNHFFLYVKQVTGEIFVNKDCKMDYQGQVGPIGHLSHAQRLLDDLSTQLRDQSLPIIQCKKNKCKCGLCAPKAQDFGTFKHIMEKYHK